MGWLRRSGYGGAGSGTLWRVWVRQVRDWLSRIVSASYGKTSPVQAVKVCLGELR